MDEILPFDDLAEKCVIGSIIKKNDEFEEVYRMVRADDFFRPSHQHIYQTITEMIADGGPVDEECLTHELRIRNLDKKCGGYDYLFAIVDETPVPNNAIHYASIVRKKALHRKVIMEALAIQQNFMEERIDSGHLVHESCDRILSILAEGTECTYHTAGELCAGRMDYFRKVYQGEIQAGDKYATGFTDLDRLFGGGVNTCELDLVAARPGQGKTSFALCEILYLAGVTKQADNPVKCLLVSIEMSDDQVSERMLSIVSGVPSQKIEFMRFSPAQQQELIKMNRWNPDEFEMGEDDYHALSIAMEKMTMAPIVVDCKSRTPDHINQTIRKAVKDWGVKFVVIDYLQKMHTSRSKYKTRDEELGHVIDELCALAKELKINIQCLAQLNREVEKRPGKQPTLADLRESGNLEAGAYKIVFLSRPEYYLEQADQVVPEDLRNLAEVIVAKNRSGRTGRTKLTFVKECTKFQNYYADDSYGR